MTDPSLADFFNDRHEHSGATYTLVPHTLVVEVQPSLSAHAGSDDNPRPVAWVVVWEAVKRGGEYAPPVENGNRYAWDVKGRAVLEPEAALSEASRIAKSEQQVRAFCESNPYEGPRRPYSERVEA